MLVEDNRDIAENVVCFLEQRGHRVDTIYSAEKALNLLEINDYDLLLLDVMLPGMDGFSLAHEIRSKHFITTPIIFLTARETVGDKIDGFTVGADDYLTKPFSLEELEMRIMAVYRRAKGLMTSVATVGGWRVDESRFEVSYQGKVIVVTKVGFAIFQLLVMSYPNVVSRREIEKKLWNDCPPESDPLRSHIFTLRKTIATVCSEPVIETIHGIGFRLNID